MSSHRPIASPPKRPRGRPRRDTTTIAAPVDARLDGALTNAISGLGTSRDKGSRTTVQQLQLLGAAEVEAIYRGGSVGRIVVDAAPDDCTRLGWTVEDDSDDTSEPYRAELERLECTQRLGEAHRLARLYGGAAVVLGIEDGQEASQPVKLAAVRRLVYLRVVDRHSLVPSESVAASLADRRTQGSVDRAPGEVWRYRLQVAGAASMEIHTDRVIRFEGAYVPERIRSQVSGWGDSYIQVAYDALANFAMVEAGLASVVHDWSIFVLKMQDLRKMVRGPLGSTALATRLSDINLAKSMINGIVLDAEGESVDWLTRNVAGLAELYDRACRSVATAVEMPATRLFGQAPGGLSTDDLSGSRNWYDRIAAMQARLYRPAIQRIVSLLQAAAGQEQSPTTVTFLPLMSPTSLEQAQIELTQAQADQIYWSMHLRPEKILERRGLITSEEADQMSRLSADEPAEPMPALPGFDGQTPSPPRLQ